jgi:HSP20 family protein
MSLLSAMENLSEEQSELFINDTVLVSDSSDNLGEGRLTIDVGQTVTELIIVATMAGTEPGDISLHVHGDLLTIRGTRHPRFGAEVTFFNNECFWGKFSRTIVLPVEVQSEMAKAQYRYGVLTIRLPKVRKDSEIDIEIMEE